MWKRFIVCLVGLAGCSLVRTPILPGADTGPLPDVPLDGGGLDAGPPDGGGLDVPLDVGSDDTGTCVPGCRGDMLDECEGTLEPCALGCLNAPAPHCASLMPSNVPTGWRSAVGPDWTVDDGASVDTDACPSTLGGRHVAMPAGGTACVIIVSELAIRAGASLYATGTYPLVIVSLRDIDLEGTLSVESSTAASRVGAGANTGGNPGGPGSRASEDGGGGGGGFGGAGGDGGCTAAVCAGDRGEALMSNLVPLVGGAPGGPGSGSSAGVGAGGGAVQLTALGTLRMGGVVIATGAGGPGDPGPQGGNGGGSGGGVLLEGVTVVVTGSISVAGGGGGAGGCGDSGGGDGEDGAVSPGGRAGGGASCGSASGAGGQGAGASEPTGGTGARGSYNDGGGGGGAGRVVARTIATFSWAGATLNPTLATGPDVFGIDRAALE
jgi:hypothetical protein